MISIQHIREQIEQLTSEHEQLLQLSERKTELIKADQIEVFQKVLMQERKQIQKISQLETKRMQSIDALFHELNITKEEKTVTTLLEHMAEGQAKRDMESAVADLLDRIVEIRSKEQLNKDLIQQSMQFVQLSLEMLQPHMQYTNYNQKAMTESSNSTSVFDSKA